MKRKKEKDYWEKRMEHFCAGRDAHARAAALRNHEHVSHVKVEGEGTAYTVCYSVAKWYVEELKKAGVAL